MQVCTKDNQRGPAVIDDVVRTADVSRGTFYKYFTSVDEAFVLLGRTLADEMTLGLMPVYGVIKPPLLRTSVGFQLFLQRGALDPTWASFVARFEHVSCDTVLTSTVLDDLESGRASGDYAFTSSEVALDFLLGTTTGGLLRFSLRRGGLAQIRELTTMVLVGLGATPTKARKAVDAGAEHIAQTAPGVLPWWSPLTS